MIIHPLHEKALKLAKEFKKLEAEIIEVLQNIDREKVYRVLGYSSLFSYATEALGFSESVAYGFITVSRKAASVPLLKKAIDSGSITVSSAKRITSVINSENALALIELASHATQKELEKKVAQMNPKLLVQERAKYVAEDRLRLELGVSEELMQKLRRIQDLCSQKQKRHVNLEEALEVMTNYFLDREDPLKKAERAEERADKRADKKMNKKTDKNADEKVNREVGKSIVAKPSSRRVPVHAALQHQLQLRDESRCAFINRSTGQRCENKRWLEIHHKIPVSRGGQNTLSNLMTLCSGHHKAIHTYDAIRGEAQANETNSFEKRVYPFDFAGFNSV